VIPQYDLSEVPNVGKRVVTSLVSQITLARVLALLTRQRRPARRLCVLDLESFTLARRPSILGTPLEYRRRTLSAREIVRLLKTLSLTRHRKTDSPLRFPPLALSGGVFDRGLRTPYFYQYIPECAIRNRRRYSVEVGYVGTRGMNLLRQIAINQHR
jgi:hypothetical protein